ncbi:hypothetical protein ACOSQ4_021016 [Xanthoceras sorbifolium]
MPATASPNLLLNFDRHTATLKEVLDIFNTRIASRARGLASNASNSTLKRPNKYPSRFFFDPLTRCICAGGVFGFAVVASFCSRGVAVEAVFVLCVRVVAAGFELWCYWVKLLLVACGAVWVVAAGFELGCFWVKLLLVVCGAVWGVAVSRFTTGVTRLNRGSLLGLCLTEFGGSVIQGNDEAGLG